MTLVVQINSASTRGNKECQSGNDQNGEVAKELSSNYGVGNRQGLYHVFNHK